MAEPTGLNADELLGEWETRSPQERLERFAALPREEADDVFLKLGSRDQLELLEMLPRGERRIWMRLLPPDDAADLIQLAEEEKRGELIGELDEVGRREVRALLAYKDDAAGGLMSPRFARVRPDMTID